MQMGQVRSSKEDPRDPNSIQPRHVITAFPTERCRVQVERSA